MSEMNLNISDLADNPTPRIPICLLLDTSYSMSGEPIRELNEGVNLFINTLLEDELARYSADLSVLTFGGTITQHIDFGPIENISMPTFSAQGDTPMGEAVRECLYKLELRKQQYKSEMCEYFQPWVVLMTDGQPTDEYQTSAGRLSSLVTNKKMTIFPIGIGDGADLEVLKEFSPSREPLRLKGLNFKGFFEWLSQSISVVSQSIPGDKIKLNVDNVSSWAEL